MCHEATADLFQPQKCKTATHIKYFTVFVVLSSLLQYNSKALKMCWQNISCENRAAVYFYTTFSLWIFYVYHIFFGGLNHRYTEETWGNDFILYSNFKQYYTRLYHPDS